MKVALVHDWTFHMRGGEKVLEAFAEMFPDAKIYTLFYRKEKLSPSLQRMNFQATWLQNIPGILKFYRWLLPLLPWTIQSLKIDADTELVLSSSHCVAKGIKVPPGAIHISYLHTPMRYLWGFEEEYFGKCPKLFRPFLNLILGLLRRWDLKSNETVDGFIANSENVRARIKTYYKKDAHVVHPPLDTKTYYPEKKNEGDYYLVVSAFVPYKKVDLVIETFNTLDKKLRIVGSGPLERDYRTRVKNNSISFLGSIPNESLRKIYSEAKALIFPTDEDFGITPLEAQACGTPIIAYGKGGALESVKTGLFFPEQTTTSLKGAILDFEKECYDSSTIPGKVSSFSKENFKTKIAAVLKLYIK